VTAGLHELPRDRTRLLDNLGWIRRRMGPVTPELSDALADHMNIRRGEVAEVASFYSYLRLPVDVVRVCTGPVCDCLGGRALLEANTGAVEVPCIGHCDLAPVIMRGDEIVPAVHHSASHGPSIDLLAPDETREPPSLEPERIVAELEASDLVGYGGAGFPTFRKWAAVRDHPGPRVVIVNADEGEPGTIKDRYVMELRPHLLAEGIEIALRFCEAGEGYVYLREEYTTARERVAGAIAARGLPITIVTGAGSYVCGEETAMLESMEGRRGMPRLRPPFPAEAGFLGRPTLINNVETLAHIPAILRLGGAAWPRTRLWSVSGAVARPGCYEAPVDVTARELIDGHAGGAIEEIGAIVPGGAASGIIPPAALDAPLTREGLAPFGAGPGSAGLQVFPTSYPVLRLLRETMRFFAEESCQKCTPCRIGTRGLEHVLDELEDGKPAMPGAQLEEWLVAMEKGSICGLGQGAPVPLRGAMRHWPELFAPFAAE
jgi:NADH:ubiquinone oxidoreductase subunit F (NADH-binding)/NADH:ubiquinone oxidoreductase subunit E